MRLPKNSEKKERAHSDRSERRENRPARDFPVLVTLAVLLVLMAKKMETSRYQGPISLSSSAALDIDESGLEIDYEAWMSEAGSNLESLISLPEPTEVDGINFSTPTITGLLENRVALERDLNNANANLWFSGENIDEPDRDKVTRLHEYTGVEGDPKYGEIHYYKWIHHGENEPITELSNPYINRLCVECQYEILKDLDAKQLQILFVEHFGKDSPNPQDEHIQKIIHETFPDGIPDDVLTREQRALLNYFHAPLIYAVLNPKAELKILIPDEEKWRIYDQVMEDGKIDEQDAPLIYQGQEVVSMASLQKYLAQTKSRDERRVGFFFGTMHRFNKYFEALDPTPQVQQIQFPGLLIEYFKHMYSDEEMMRLGER